MFALASVGGATLPWTIGAVSTHFGQLRPGLFIPLSTTALMILLYVVPARGVPTAGSKTANSSEVAAVQ
jgi:fucose permease